VNIAKFGAFISIMPGRDGLLHISKMGPLNDGKRIGQVEDVVELGQALEVRVDDIDPQARCRYRSRASSPARKVAPMTRLAPPCAAREQ